MPHLTPLHAASRTGAISDHSILEHARARHGEPIACECGGDCHTAVRRQLARRQTS